MKFWKRALVHGVGGVARFSTRAFSFANGEVSPLVQQRADMEFYYTALKTALNVVPDQFGNLHRRPGTRHVLVAPEVPCLYRIEAGPEEPMIVVAYPGRFEFLLDGADIGVSVDTPYGADDYCSLKFVEDCGAAFFFSGKHPVQKLVRTGAGFSLGPLEASPLGSINADRGCKLCLGAGGSAAGGVITMRSHVAAAGDIVPLTRDNGATVVNATVASYNGAGICEVTGAGLLAGTWQIWDASAGVPPGPGLPPPGATVGDVTISMDRAKLTGKDCQPFTADMVGQQVNVLDETGVGGNDPNNWVTVTVLEFTSAGEVVVEYSGEEVPCTDLFQLPAFYGGKYPSFGWIDQDRLWLGNENCVAGSKTGDFFNWNGFDPDGTVNPDNAIYLKIGAGRCSNVQWLQTVGRQLLVGTTNSINSIFGSGVGGAFQADGTGQQVIDEAGASAVRPVVAGGSALFVDRGRRRLFSTGPGAQYDQIALGDQNIFADHIGEKLIKKIAFQEYPFPIVWVVTDDGGLYSMTFWPGQAVRGWSRHVLGGRLMDGGCEVAPRVLDVEVQKSADGLRSVVAFVVKRTVGASEVVHLETLGEFFRHYSTEEEAHFLDAALPLNGTAAVVASAAVSRAAPLVLWSFQPAGRAAFFDGLRWFYGDAQADRVVMDAPNTFKAVPGRTLRLGSDGGWVPVARPAYGKSPPFVGPLECLYDPPCQIIRHAPCVEEVAGLDHLNGEEVVAYLDANDLGAFTVSGGKIAAGGCVGWVGLPYVSMIEPLAYRVQLGATDGANDPSKVLSVSFNLYRTPMVEVGGPGQNEFMGTGDNYKPVDLPEEFETHHRAFHSGWVKGLPLVSMGNNDGLGIAVRIWGPWPAILRGMEATLYASGGK